MGVLIVALSLVGTQKERNTIIESASLAVADVGDCG